MHVYLRWYADGRPQEPPQRMTDEYSAKEAVWDRYPDATFSERVDAAEDPNANLGWIVGIVYAWPDQRTERDDPVADILFPER